MIKFMINKKMSFQLFTIIIIYVNDDRERS